MISVAGIRCMKSNHIPSGDESSTGTADSTLGSDQVMNDTAGTGAGYSTGSGYSGVNYTNTKAVVFQSEGIGTVKLMDLGVETDYSVERQGTVLVAKYAMGHGVLREECCYRVIV